MCVLIFYEEKEVKELIFKAKYSQTIFMKDLLYSDNFAQIANCRYIFDIFIKIVKLCNNVTSLKFVRKSLHNISCFFIVEQRDHSSTKV